MVSGKCTFYGDINTRYNDLTDDADLVGFFTEVLARRDEAEDQEEDDMVAREATEYELVSQEEEGGETSRSGV